MEKIRLSEKFDAIREYWSPRIAGRVNDCAIKLAKLKGEFSWHHHESEDEAFLVVQGALTIQFRDRDVHLGEGEMLVVPRGVEHRPVAEEEAHVMMIEPVGTLNTGNVRNERTVANPEEI